MKGTGRDPSFNGFGIMAAALAGSGVNVLQAVVGAVVGAGMLKFLLVDIDVYYRKWVRDLGNGTCETETGRQHFIADVRVCEQAYALNFAALDWKKSSYYVPNGDAGWLSPEGVIWSCEYEGHQNLATYVIRQTYDWLEANGWVHVDGAGREGEKSYRMVRGHHSPGAPTEAQLAWLAANGHDVAYHGHGAKAKPVETFTVAGYTLDKEAERKAFEKYMALAPKR